MNLVDFLIVLALIGAVVRGIRHGFVRRILALAGFTIGILIGAWTARAIVQEGWDPVIKLGFIFGIVIVFAMAVSFAGEVAGLHLTHKAHAKRKKAKPANQTLGAAFEVIFILVLVWLLSSSFTNVRSYEIGEKVRKSAIIKVLYKTLQPPPNILASLEKIIAPNGFPSVFIGLEPQHTKISPNNTISDELILKAEKSVVKVRGPGCGGTIEGSGFVVGKELVMTNAHVVAGVRNPVVLNSLKTYKTTPVWYDPDLDVAMLYVIGLPDEPLSLAERELKISEAGVILGFPGGGDLMSREAVVISRTTAEGYNIYSTGRVFRNIYQLQANIEHGNSGGPLVNREGSVSGVVFAKAIEQDDVGYALAISNLKPIIKKAVEKKEQVYTGTCAQR